MEAAEEAVVAVVVVTVVVEEEEGSEMLSYLHMLSHVHVDNLSFWFSFKCFVK